MYISIYIYIYISIYGGSSSGGANPEEGEEDLEGVVCRHQSKVYCKWLASVACFIIALSANSWDLPLSIEVAIEVPSRFCGIPHGVFYIQSSPIQSIQSIKSNPIQSNQSNPIQSIQSNPIQSNSIQSNKCQSNPIHSNQSNPIQSKKIQSK